MSMINIGVTAWTKGKLEDIKKKEGHTSLDSVIKTLLLKTEK